MAIPKFQRFINSVLKALIAVLIITGLPSIQAMDPYDYDANSSDSDSDSNGMNIFRVIPKPPSYDPPMENLIQNFGGLRIEAQDYTLYNRALVINIQKCQELYNVLTDMLKLTTNATSFTYVSWIHDMSELINR